MQNYVGHQKPEKGIDCASSIFCANIVYEDDASMKFQFNLPWKGAFKWVMEASAWLLLPTF